MNMSSILNGAYFEGVTLCAHTCICGVMYVHMCAGAHVEAREGQVTSLPYSFEIKSFTELGARDLQLKSLQSFHPYTVLELTRTCSNSQLVCGC